LYAGKDTTFSVNERKQLDDIHLLSPGDGYKWVDKDRVVGKKVKATIKRNEIIYPKDIE
jgi:sialic acid synthase